MSDKSIFSHKYHLLSFSLRTIGLLESAVASANNSFYDVEQYPSLEEKAARLAFAIVSNHAFIDGNKRIGILVMLMTLKLNNIKIFYSQQDLVNLGQIGRAHV